MDRIIIVSGPVIVENNKVLLNNHGDTDFWKFCGGRAENKKEDLIDIAKREAKEEMGIDIEILDQEPFITFARKNDLDIILVHWLAKRIGEIKPGADIRDWQWFDLNNLPHNLGPNILPALKHFGFIK
mgnify:CR=1 FL=1